jgi:hypothetical protein
MLGEGCVFLPVRAEQNIGAAICLFEAAFDWAQQGLKRS